MKKIGFLTFGFIFAGCFLGAGYLSGNELMQFFGDFGIKGILGLLLSISLIGVFGIMILFIAKRTNTEKFEDIVFPHSSKILASVFGALQAVLVFAVIVIMVAGAAQLVFDAFHVSTAVTAALFCAVIALVSCAGFGGVSKFFSFLVPTIAACAVIAALILVSKNSFPTIPGDKDLYVNALLGNWFFAAVTYVSYSIFSSVGMIAPLIHRQKNSRTYVYGTVFGTALLIAIALSILVSVFAVQGSENTQIPMFSAIIGISKIFAYFYAVLLFGGMFGTALTSMVSLSNYARLKFNLSKIKTIIAVIIFSTAAYIASLFGFDKLIGTVYPLFGYFGILVLVLILINFLALLFKRKEK